MESKSYGYSPLNVADRLLPQMTYNELLTLRRWIDEELDYLDYFEIVYGY